MRYGLLVIGGSLLALAVVSSGLLPGIYIEGRVSITLIVAGLVLALLNALVRPIVKLLTCPFVLVALALFLFVLNALMLLVTAWVTEWLAPYTGGRLVVVSFGWALLGGLIIAVIVTALTTALDWWQSRVPVAPPPNVRQIAQAQRAQLDQQFDATVSSPPPGPPPNAGPPS